MRFVERAAAAAFLVLLYTGWCVFVGVSARSKSLSFWTGFWPSFLLTPILGFIMVSRKVKPPRKVLPPPVSPEERRFPCPGCTEMIVYGASACRFCGMEFLEARE